MTHNFKPGDKITMKPGTFSAYGVDVGGKTGKIFTAGFVSSKNPRHTLEVEFPTPAWSVLVRPEDVVVVEDKDSEIHAALARVKANGNGGVGYCSDFDRAVKEAVDMPLLKRLAVVAKEKYRGDIYNELLEELKPKPEYKDGDRVHYTVNNTDFVQALIDGEWVYEYNPLNPDRISQDYDRKPFPHPDRKIINTVNLKPGREYTAPDLPEIGRWIKATDEEGTTKTIQVDRHDERETATVINARWGDTAFNARIAKSGKRQLPTGNIVSWEYTDAPVVPVKIGDYFIIRDEDEVKVYSNKEGAENYKRWGGLVHVNSVKHGYELIAEFAQRDATYHHYIPAVIAAIKFIEREEK